MSDVAALAEPEVVKPVVPKSYSIKESHVQRAEFGNTVWRADIDPGTPFEEILRPEFWAHVTVPRSFNPGDKIELYPQDGSYYAMLLVRDCGATWAKVEVLLEKKFEAGRDPVNIDTSGYEVHWQGPVNKYVVIRLSDKAVISKGFKAKEDAQIALLNHVKDRRN